jgi:ABC-type transport system involved in cytochrome c biogenesis ATPase subunit
MPAAAILTASGLTFSHPGGGTRPLFDGLSFSLPPGVTWVGGDESTGKTSLLKILAGVLPAGGQLSVNGVSMALEPERYRQQVAWLDPQDTRHDQSGVRLVLTTLCPSGSDAAGYELQALVEGLSLAPHLDKSLFMLSAGSRRKVLIAATLASPAPVVLLDQLFTALDRPSVDYLLGLLAQAATQDQRTWVVADYVAPPGIALGATVNLDI